MGKPVWVRKDRWLGALCFSRQNQKMKFIEKIIKFISELFFGIEETESTPYLKKDYLLTIAEKEFYFVLKKIADETNTLIFAKVRLEDLLRLPRGIYGRRKMQLRGWTRSRHIDFVLCDSQSIRPLVAIELDDSSHEREDRIEIDKRKDKILEDAGLPLLRVKVRSYYDPEELFKNIKEKLTDTLKNGNLHKTP